MKEKQKRKARSISNDNYDVLIFSSCEYSLNNRGDYAMLSGIIQQLTLSIPKVKITAYEMQKNALQEIENIKTFPSPEKFILISGDTSRLKVLCRGIHLLALSIVYRTPLRRFMKPSHLAGFFHQMFQAKAVVFSGGGYLNSLWWADGLYSKLFPALIARSAGVPVILTSQGLGPYTCKLDKIVAWGLFNVATIIGVRDDEQSKKTVRKISRRLAKKVLDTGDDATLLSPRPYEEIKTLLKSENVNLSAPYLIAVNLRDSSTYQNGYDKPDFSMIAQTLDSLINTLNAHIIFVPISYHDVDDDRISAKKIVLQMAHQEETSIISGIYPPAMIKGVMKNSDIAIGTSYHFSLFALSQNIPAIGLYQDIYYKQKLDGLFSIYNQDSNCLDMRSLNYKTLTMQTKQLLLHKNEITHKLLEKNKALNKKFSNSRTKIRQSIMGEN